MKTHILKSLMFAVLCGIVAFSAHSAVSLFSDYGQIQNVQSYSSNPFWSPNSPYNQRLPQPVYVQGVDVTSDECSKVVDSLVAVQCMARNNCKNTSLSEIRPEIMVQLSKLPGKNYVSSCAGYIDTAFESYVQQYGNTLPNREVSFPGATQPTNNNQNTGVQIKNPYQRNIPKWQQEINERNQELLELQKENGVGNEHLSKTDFPATYADLSFKSKMELMNEGYEPYKDKSAYKVPDFQTAAKWCADGSHKNSPECVAYFERLKDCTSVAKEANPSQKDLIVHAEYKGKTKACEVVTCAPGYDPNAQKNGCKKIDGTDCIKEAKKSDENAETAEIKDGKCVIKTCKDGKTPDASGTHCVDPQNCPNGSCSSDGGDSSNTSESESAQGEDCTEKMKEDVNEEQKKLIKKATQEQGGECKITECVNEYEPAQDGKTCEKETKKSKDKNTVSKNMNYRIGIMFANSDKFAHNQVIEAEDNAISFDTKCSDTTVYLDSISNNAAINTEQLTKDIFTGFPQYKKSSDFFIDFANGSMPPKNTRYIFPGLLLFTNDNGLGDIAIEDIATENFIVMYSRQGASPVSLNNGLATAKALKNKLTGSACAGLSIYLVALNANKDGTVKEINYDLNAENYQTHASFKANAQYETDERTIHHIKKSLIERVKILAGPYTIE
jgi:hypothetical protein